MKRRQLFKYISTDISIHLYCAICKDVFYKPIRTECGQAKYKFRHTFCGECIMLWFRQKQTCPQCRQKRPKNFKYDKDNVAQQIVEDYAVECQRCTDWIGPLKSFKNHLKESCSQKIAFDSPEYEDGQLIDLSEFQECPDAEIQEYDPTPQEQVPILCTSQKIKKFKLKLKQTIKVQEEPIQQPIQELIPNVEIQVPTPIIEIQVNENEEPQNIVNDTIEIDLSTQEQKSNYQEDQKSPFVDVEDIESDQSFLDRFVEYCKVELVQRLAYEIIFESN